MDIEAKVKEILFLEKGKTILLVKEIEEAVIQSIGREDYYAQGGYRLFAKTILTMIDEGKIKAITKDRKNGLNPNLPLRIKIVPTQISEHAYTQYREFLITLHPAISLSFYQNRPDELEADRHALMQLNSFFKSIPSLSQLPQVSVNERSYQIFGNEKFLLSGKGQKILQRTGLSLKALQSYITHEPFFYYQTHAITETRVNALIVENKDTFFSLKSIFAIGLFKLDYTNIHILIYGEGKKIEKSLPFIEEITDKDIRLLYFGDIDPEGISIFCRLLATYPQYQLSPCLPLYSKLLKLYANNASLIENKQTVNFSDIESFCQLFSDEISTTLRSILISNRYIPQEGLRRDILEEIFKGEFQQ
jgi:hypothetical protein